MTYQLTILDKLATEDSFEDGEVGQSTSIYLDEKVTGKTINEVIEKACDIIGGDYEGNEKCWSIDIDANEGRIDFQTLENEDGYTPSNTEIEQWKLGKLKLYACYYVGRIEQVTAVNLEKVTA